MMMKRREKEKKQTKESRHRKRITRGFPFFLLRNNDGLKRKREYAKETEEGLGTLGQSAHR